MIAAFKGERGSGAMQQNVALLKQGTIKSLNPFVLLKPRRDTSDQWCSGCWVPERIDSAPASQRPIAEEVLGMGAPSVFTLGPGGHMVLFPRTPTSALVIG